MQEESEISCTIRAEPLRLRSEGLTELVGRIRLTFKRLNETPNGRKVDIRVFFNTAITNWADVSHKTDASAMVTDQGETRPPVYGYLEGVSSIVFRQVEISAAETICDISGIRVNASALGSGASVFASHLSVRGTERVRAAETAVVVGDSSQSLSFGVLSSTGGHFAFRASEGIQTADQGVRTRPAVYLAFREKWPGVFRSRQHETVQSSHSAESGTRLMARFRNIPENVEISVGRRDSSDMARRAVFVDTDHMGAGGQADVESKDDTLVHIPIHNGSGYAVWEYICNGPPSDEPKELLFPVVLAAKPSAGDTGTASVGGWFAPISTEFQSSQSAPVPRFVDASVPTQLFTVTE